MKNKHEHTIHQRIERFFRHSACVYGVLGIVAVGVSRADAHVLNTLHQAYVHGFGTLGTFLREEPTRMHVDFGTSLRIVNTSGE